MKNPSPDPKKLLAALVSGAPAELPFDAAAVERARAFAQDPANAPPEEVKALPHELLDAVLEAAVQKRASKLAEALAAAPEKAVQKAGKKAVYRLRSAGEKVEVPKPPAAEPPRHEEAVEELPSVLTGVTGTGERALFVARTGRRGFELTQLILSDEHGVIHLSGGRASRSAYRSQLREIRAGHVAPAVGISRDRVREELNEAVGLNLRSRTPFPDGLDELVRVYEVIPLEELPPLPQPEPEDASLAVDAHALHAEPEIQAWLPPEKELRVLGERMEQVIHSPLELSEAQRSSQLTESFHKAAEDFFTLEMKKLYARRLWRMAEQFDVTGRQSQARLARAEARRLFHDAPGLFTRFGEELFTKVLELTRRAQAGKKLPEPGPQEPPKVEPQEKRSPGGLIIP